jgi:hypothetical protein
MLIHSNLKCSKTLARVQEAGIGAGGRVHVIGLEAVDWQHLQYDHKMKKRWFYGDSYRKTRADGL